VRAGGFIEKALVTSGDDLIGIARFLPPNESNYSAAHVISTLLGDLQTRCHTTPQKVGF
jgi:hypothetical protein